MERTELLAQIQLWHETEEHGKIVETVEALSREEWDYELTCLLARAYNNLWNGREDHPLLEKAIELLESVEAQGQDDPLWHYRMGYALFYLDREEESLMYFQKSLEMNPDDLDAQYFIDQCEKFILERENGESGGRDLEDYPYFATLHLNARFQPMHRHDLEDALEEVLLEHCLGSVDGGGTAQMPSGEISSCDIELCLRDLSQETLDKVAEIVDRLGVPKGSELLWNTGGNSYEQQPVGRLEGMAVYLNGTELPAEVYETSDVNFVIQQMDTLMEGIGGLYSWWEGPEDTALYFYGESYEKMLEAVSGFLVEYPLCQKCQVKQIA